MKRIPLSRCKRCVHYNNGRCPLADLDPCAFIDRDPNRSAKNRYLAAAVAVALAFILFVTLTGCRPQTIPATPVGPGLYAVEYHGHEYLINPNGGLLHSDSCPCWEKYEELETIYE